MQPGQASGQTVGGLPESDEDEVIHVDHPHMRSSLESERGVPFISGVHSPTGSYPDDITPTGIPFLRPGATEKFS